MSKNSRVYWPNEKIFPHYIESQWRHYSLILKKIGFSQYIKKRDR